MAEAEGARAKPESADAGAETPPAPQACGSAGADGGGVSREAAAGGRAVAGEAVGTEAAGVEAAGAEAGCCCKESSTARRNSASAELDCPRKWEAAL